MEVTTAAPALPVVSPADAPPSEGAAGATEESPPASGAAPEKEEEDPDDQPPTQAEAAAAAAVRAANVAALVGGDLAVTRAPALRSLTVDADAVLRRAFVCPHPAAPAGGSHALARKLAKRSFFVPWGATAPTRRPMLAGFVGSDDVAGAGVDALNLDDGGPPPGEPLVLWQRPPEAAPAPPADGGEGPSDAPAPPPPGPTSIEVDPMLTRWLRPHQREGVTFMWECVTGQRKTGEGGRGVLLADDMGLGKTLQALALAWTMLTAPAVPELGALAVGAPIARRAVICCPTSLVGNWEAEARKFLKGRLRVLALCEASREEAAAAVGRFLGPRGDQVLVVSYETFRIHAPRFVKAGAPDLLICDEAHRLKNDQTLTNRALAALPCPARVLLSGTPLQNQLGEFFAMVDFTNPGVLGSLASFRKRYEAPILAGREPGAEPDVAAKGAARAAELSATVNEFILRRTNALLSAHLPPKVVAIVCCRLAPLQQALYDHFLKSVAGARLLAADAKAAAVAAAAAAAAAGEAGAGATTAVTAVQPARTAHILSAVTALRKLCNHPKLIWDSLKAASRLAAVGSGSRAAAGPPGFEGCEAVFPPGVFDPVGGGGGRAAARGFGGSTGGSLPAGWPAHSGKFAFVAALLQSLVDRAGGVVVAGTAAGTGGRAAGGRAIVPVDRVVLVSNATQTLDLFATLCREKSWPCLRLDGSTSVTKRTKLVAAFNDPARREFVFLLSSKAGGCGLNLVGANRLVLFDPAWNPADDKQAAARVWRDGQARRVFVYRLLASGALDEKIFQRQCSKEGLKCVVDGAGGEGGGGTGGDDEAGPDAQNAALLSAEELRDLFTLRSDTASDTLDALLAAEAEGRLDGGGGSGGPDAPGRPLDRAQDGTPAEEEISKYARHSDPATVPDPALVAAAAAVPGTVSFVFSLSVDGKPVTEDGEAGPAPAALPPPPALKPALLVRPALADATNVFVPPSKRAKSGVGAEEGGGGGGPAPAVTALLAARRPAGLRRGGGGRGPAVVAVGGGRGRGRGRDGGAAPAPRGRAKAAASSEEEEEEEDESDGDESEEEDETESGLSSARSASEGEAEDSAGEEEEEEEEEAEAGGDDAMEVAAAPSPPKPKAAAAKPAPAPARAAAVASPSTSPDEALPPPPPPPPPPAKAKPAAKPAAAPPLPPPPPPPPTTVDMGDDLFCDDDDAFM